MCAEKRERERREREKREREERAEAPPPKKRGRILTRSEKAPWFPLASRSLPPTLQKRGRILSCATPLVSLA